MKTRFIASFLLAALLLASCNGTDKSNNGSQTSQNIDYTKVAIPDFCADSAFKYVADQLSFGFRHPGLKGHDECGFFLAHKLQRWCDTVVQQSFTTTLWNGDKVHGKNIIASLNPEKERRILLAAHWDSRQWADHDIDTNNWRKPLLGANDGASGAALLLEMARVMSAMRPDVGVDFVLFDLEDQGIPEWAGRYEDNTWCKGSQFWAQNPHQMFYSAEYGILFDMVGTHEPRFTKEEISMNFAPGLMNKVWNCAAGLGYGNIFQDKLSGAILDDHLYVNQIRHIPMIDIVQNSSHCSFYEHWHTVNDNLDAIDKNTLKTVATVVMKVIYAD